MGGERDARLASRRFFRSKGGRSREGKGAKKEKGAKHLSW